MIADIPEENRLYSNKNIYTDEKLYLSTLNSDTAWTASDINQSIKLDLPPNKVDPYSGVNIIYGIVIKGYAPPNNFNNYVKKFKVKYINNDSIEPQELKGGQEYIQQNNDYDTIFYGVVEAGNINNYTYYVIFNNPPIAKSIIIYPMDYVGSISMRVDLIIPSSINSSPLSTIALVLGETVATGKSNDILLYEIGANLDISSQYMTQSPSI